MGLKSMVARARPPAKEKIVLSRQDYVLRCCADGHVHIDLLVNGVVEVDLVLEDDNEAYEFAQGLLRCFDYLNGIAEQ